MLISEYLALRNQISVTTGNTAVRTGESTAKDAVQNGSGTFAQALQEKLVEKHGVEKPNPFTSYVKNIVVAHTSASCRSSHSPAPLAVILLKTAELMEFFS